MKTSYARILVLAVLMTATAVHAQFNPDKVCRIEDGNLVFTLDKRWNASQRKEISRVFSLDSTLLSAAFAMKPLLKDSCNEWRTRRLDANLIELTLLPCKITEDSGSAGKILLLDDQYIKYGPAPGTPVNSEPYGVNRLTRPNVVQLSSGRLRYFLPGHRNAKQVFISGSFNKWSTGQTPMQKNDSGWVVTLNLQPGKYTCKFIIDGKWVSDPYNKTRESDTYGGFNNVLFCYNYKFVLNGYPDARNVFVAGSFNNWNGSEIRMIRFRGQWVLPLFLREGTHAYKFIVDGAWITDPANQVTRPDGRGNLNSFMGIGDTLFFTLKGYPGAERVVVCGNFNDWNTEELAMVSTPEGWQLPYVLAPGNYEYKFIVDGKWITDPSNPITVGGDDFLNSYLVVKPNHHFRLAQHTDAGKVIVSGSFNNWNQQDYRMEKQQGVWWFPVHLNPGKHSYKFIVDGKWIIDPSNPLWEENEYGTGNSVLWIE